MLTCDQCQEQAIYLSFDGTALVCEKHKQEEWAKTGPDDIKPIYFDLGLWMATFSQTPKDVLDQKYERLAKMKHYQERDRQSCEDIFKTPLRIGQVVTWSGRSGNTGFAHIGVIREITIKRETVEQDNDVVIKLIPQIKVDRLVKGDDGFYCYKPAVVGTRYLAANIGFTEYELKRRFPFLEDQREGDG